MNRPPRAGAAAHSDCSLSLGGDLGDAGSVATSTAFPGHPGESTIGLAKPLGGAISIRDGAAANPSSNRLISGLSGSNASTWRESSIAFLRSIFNIAWLRGPGSIW